VLAITLQSGQSVRVSSPSPSNRFARIYSSRDAPVEPLPGWSVKRRKTSSRTFEFVDDQNEIIGTMRRRWTGNGTTSTPHGTYQSVGLGARRMVNLATSEVLLGKGVGWRLPDGRAMVAHKSRGHADATLYFSDPSGAAVLHLKWLPPVSPYWGSFPSGVASFAKEIDRELDLVPVISFAFQMFAAACTIQRGGA